MKNSTIISAFPGTGKTYYCHNGNWSQYAPEKWSTDSDSSKFSKDEFPQNYIKHIKSKVGEYRYIFVSSHKEVRDALVKEGLPFDLVYPSLDLKHEYLQRYKARGNNESFINLLEANWGKWLKELPSQKGCNHVVLKSNQFISNIY